MPTITALAPVDLRREASAAAVTSAEFRVIQKQPGGCRSGSIYAVRRSPNLSAIQAERAWSCRPAILQLPRHSANAPKWMAERGLGQ
jgi:hypothetical protein